MKPADAAPPPIQFICPECGAENLPSHPRCWLCYEKLTPVAKPFAPSPEQPRPRQSAAGWVMFSMVIGTVLLLAMVAIGAFSIDPNLGWLFCIILVPPAAIGLITFGVSYALQPKTPPAHSASGGPAEFIPSTAAKPIATGLSTFFASLAATLGIVLVAIVVAIMVVVAAIIALVETCFGLLGGHP